MQKRFAIIEQVAFSGKGGQMNTKEIERHARSLYTAHGDRAEFEAAQRAREVEEMGNQSEADDWQRIRAAIRQIRGPNES